MRSNISEPTIYRLCMTLRLLDDLVKNGVVTVSSSKLGNFLNITPYTLRKDLSLLKGKVVSNKDGYEVKSLIKLIRLALKIKENRLACVVGLGRIGTAILNYNDFNIRGYKIVMGFDSNINKIETIKTDIDVYPSYEIEEMVEEKNVKLGIIAVPAEFAQKIADRLINGGVKGIINFAPVVIKTECKDVKIKNIDIVTELNFLSTLVL